MALKKKKKPSSSVSLPESLRTPLREGSEASIAGEAEHSFFLRCFELYRVIELSDRTLEPMVEAYSKYRTRDLFRETLQFRYFDFERENLEGIDPALSAHALALFNALHELRISLMHEDALPFTVKSRIENSLGELKRQWNSLSEGLEARHGWKFKFFAV